MNTAIFKTKGFYVGLTLFLIMTLIAVLKLEFSIYKRIAIILVCLVLYVLQEAYQTSELYNKLKPEIVEGILASIDKFLKFDDRQRLRSNIFFYKKKNKHYFIKYHHNMETCDDKSMEIPENLGCTGEAWRSKKQVWGDKDKIFKVGDFKVPLEQLEKVPKDLEWICSTPILRDSNVIAVMNFDGNKPVSQEQQKEIMNHCSNTCEKLNKIL